MPLLPHTDPAWLTAWNRSNDREVFAHPAYAALFEDEKTQACAFLYESPQGSILYPFLLRNLQGEPFWRQQHGPAFDMATPYGYGGPVVISGPPTHELYLSFFAALRQWALQNKVITEFVRFSLFSRAHLAYYGQVQHHNDNIVVDLGLGHEELWKGFRHKVRKNVRTALAAGITIVEDRTAERLDAFLKVYHDTLGRRNAAAHYFKPAGFFRKLAATLPQHFIFFHALSGEMVVASELVLISGTRIYSYLGGTFSKSYGMRPGDLLKYHIMQWARQQGFRQFVIGGGHKPHDGIFAFKKAFAPQGIFPFHVGKMVFDHQTYHSLTSADTISDGFFPAYRTNHK